MSTTPDDQACPSCGGSGGGPFGRPGSAWDVEDYVCPRCQGLGTVGEVQRSADDASAARPGIAKTALPAAPRTDKRARGKT